MKGYILKFYRKVNSISTIKNGEIYFSWQNFDFFEQIEVDSFSSFYEKSLDLLDAGCKNLTHFRQKIYVCGNNEKDIFSREQHAKYPIISMSMVKFGSDYTVQKLKSTLEEKLAGQGVVEMFETLSDYDSVFVLRTNSLESTLRILSTLYLVENYGNLKELYTIVSVDVANVGNMSSEDCVKASIRLLHPFGLTSFADKKYKHYSTFGRNDGLIEYGMVSTRELVQMFIQNKLFENNKNIYSTDIAIEMKDDDVKSIVDYRDIVVLTEQQEDIKTKYSAILKKIDDSNYSNMLKTMLMRTVLRVTQSSIADYSCNISRYLQELVYSVVEAVLSYNGSEDYSQSVIEMIQSFNLLMDNCVFSNQYNFEFPNNNLRSTGTMVRLLCAYNALLQEIQEVLEQFRSITDGNSVQGNLKQANNYFIWCVSEMQAMVSAKQLFVEPTNRLRFMVFGMTPEVMLKPQFAIPFLYHESGHFFRAGWERSVRNKSLRECATYMFMQCWTSLEGTFGSYQMETFMRYLNFNSINMADIYAQAPAPTNIGDAEYEHGNQQLKMLIRFYDNLISDIYENRLEGIYPTQTAKWEMKERMVYCLNEMYSAYLESAADVFMIRALAIRDFDKYLPIVSEYLEYHNVKQENIGLGILIRITAIGVLMSVLKDEESGKAPLQSIYQRILEVQSKIMGTPGIKAYVFNASDYFDYAACIMALYEFLKEHVWTSMENIINSAEGDTIKKHFDEIETTYSKFAGKENKLQGGFDFTKEYMSKL